MNVKVSKEERIRLREARHELQIIITRARKICFEYIVVPPKKQRVCFGSGIEKECLPTEGPALSPFMRRFIQRGPIPSPVDYTCEQSLIKKMTSLRGYGGLASKAARIMGGGDTKNPPPGQYNIYFARDLKQCPKPFGMGSKLFREPKFVTPPPSFNFYKRKENVSDSFGSDRKIIPAVKMICTSINLSKCYKCEKKPIGDYWHDYSTNHDLCRICMKREREAVGYKCDGILTIEQIRRRRELEKYIRVRHCGFYHQHNGTSAAVRLLSRQELTKKLRVENYLSKFYM